MKTYVFADAHGRFDLVKLAYLCIKEHAGDNNARIICLGDFVDRGPQSRQIIEFFMERQENDNQFEWVILQGNHEDIMIQALSDIRHLRWWKGNGGGATLKSYGASSGNNPHYTTQMVPFEHYEWLRDLPVTFEDEHRIYVHAGLPMDKPIDEVSKETKQWMLYRDLNGHYFPDAEYHQDAPNHISGKHIVHGHEQSKDHPLLLEGRTNLDSFAWATGKLAVGIFDETQASPIDTFVVESDPDPRYLTRN